MDTEKGPVHYSMQGVQQSALICGWEATVMALI